jgi:Na+-transporting NADH:ubiquinone oxidoreductase subunit E
MELTLIIVGAVLTNNILLTTFLGLCPFIGVSGEWRSALGMGMAVIFVMTLTAPTAWVVNHFILIPLKIEYLRYIAYIVIIASLVQIVELFVMRFSPLLYRTLGIYLPLITVNCAIFGMTLFMTLWKFNFIQSVLYGFGAGVGWTLAILAMASIRERLRFTNIPKGLEGPAITLIIAGLMALGFFGFSGMVDIRGLGG